jgi:hypothetical protein
VLEGEKKGSPLKFGSWEERCDACQIYGGEQEPCCNEAKRALIEKEHGRPCPRILLAPGSAELVTLANMALAESPLLPIMVGSITAGLEPEEVQEAIIRIEAVRAHPLVVDARERAIERASREKEARKGSR